MKRLSPKTSMEPEAGPNLCTLHGPSCSMGDSQNYGYHFGGPYMKDYCIFGSRLGSTRFGKLPCRPYTLNYPKGYLEAHGT